MIPLFLLVWYSEWTSHFTLTWLHYFAGVTSFVMLCCSSLTIAESCWSGFWRGLLYPCAKIIAWKESRDRRNWDSKGLLDCPFCDDKFFNPDFARLHLVEKHGVRK